MRGYRGGGKNCRGRWGLEQQEYEINLISSISLYSYRVSINSFNNRSIIPSDTQLMMAEIRTQQN
jgi:hypothetical protein